MSPARLAVAYDKKMHLYINLKMNTPIQGATQMGVDWTLLLFARKILDSIRTASRRPDRNTKDM
jgi:hypothetical protein